MRETRADDVVDEWAENETGTWLKEEQTSSTDTTSSVSCSNTQASLSAQIRWLLTGPKYRQAGLARQTGSSAAATAPRLRLAVM
jgi:hypothetical protein